MTLQLFDTATRTVREFRPAHSGTVSMYVCGATVQDIPHIGHVRGALNYDVLRRWFLHQNLEVRFVRNVTDIDDAILTKAAAAGRPWWEWAATHERIFEDAFSTLGCLPPSVTPRATGHIPQMLELIQRLIDTEHAYVSGGNVYFSVASFNDYGVLSRQRLDDVQQGEEQSEGKHDPRDFTLWKTAKSGEPSWPTPWGRGRPGWHLECSAMATTYLGSEFDLHGGGVDLVFPHHENERAQSRAAGDGFAQHWLHNAWVTLAGEKMSKSLGNIVSMPQMLRRHRPVELRYYLVQPHYRSVIEYSDAALSESSHGYRRIEQFLRRVAAFAGHPRIGDLPDDFAAALDDDLSTPRAVAVLHNAVRDGNSALDDADRDQALGWAETIRAMTDVLGVDPLSEQWAESSSTQVHALNTLVDEILGEREQARAARNFAQADALRDQLLRAGITVEDTPGGPTWTMKD